MKIARYEATEVANPLASELGGTSRCTHAPLRRMLFPEGSTKP